MNFHQPISKLICIQFINRNIFIAGYDLESNKSYLIELSLQKGLEIFTKFNNDYDYLANNLRLMNDRLILVNPVILIFYFIFGIEL